MPYPFWIRIVTIHWHSIRRQSIPTLSSQPTTPLQLLKRANFKKSLSSYLGMACSLVESLNLTLTASELNANEWTHFLSELGKEFILKAIKCLKSDDINRTISTMKQIIQSRDEIPSNARAKVECIDQLSSGLIGEIGSYLNAKDYGRFEQCNRTLYVASNSPNKVQELRPFPSTLLDNMEQFKLCKYPSVRRLYCWNMDVRKLSIPSAISQ